MCHSCYQPDYLCSCESDCPIKLDFACIIYNKEGKDASKLQGLNLPNGSTLRLVVELIDEKIKQLNVVNYSIPFLRTISTINNIQKFAEVVDSQISALKSNLVDISTDVSPDVVGSNTPSINIGTSGTQGHTISANLKVSAQAGNTISVLSDGVYNNPQTLNVNYTNKTLSIANGNTVDLSALVQAPSGYLGNVVSDPSTPLDGNYWFNTVQNKLKIRVNGGIKEIVTI